MCTWEVLGDGSSSWIPATLVRDPHEVPGFDVASPQIFMGTWSMKQIISSFPCFSLPCLSNKLIKNLKNILKIERILNVAFFILFSMICFIRKTNRKVPPRPIPGRDRVTLEGSVLERKSCLPILSLSTPPFLSWFPWPLAQVLCPLVDYSVTLWAMCLNVLVCEWRYIVLGLYVHDRCM